MKGLNRLPSCLLFWCVAAQSPKITSLPSDLNDLDLSVNLSARLEELSDTANRLSDALGAQSDFYSPLRLYKLNADKLVSNHLPFIEFISIASWVLIGCYRFRDDELLSLFVFKVFVSL